MTQTKVKPAEEETKGLGLSSTQLVAGAGASVTSTVVASTAGVGGTLGGAALGSIVSTVAAALYAHSLKRGREKVTKVLPVGTPAGSTAAPGRDDTKVLPAHLDPRKSKTGRFDIQLNRKFWLRCALVAAGMFVVVMAVITGVELLTAKPVSALVGNTDTSRSTTLGTVTDDTPSTPTAPEDQQEEDTPVTTTTPDDPTGTPERTQESSEAATEVTRTAESTARTSDSAEPTVERQQQQDEEEAPAQRTAEPDTDTADTE
jgi:hypothetical protein